MSFELNVTFSWGQSTFQSPKSTPPNHSSCFWKRNYTVARGLLQKRQNGIQGGLSGIEHILCSISLWRIFIEDPSLEGLPSL